MMAHGAPSSSIIYKWTYDVFLSFHGEDTRFDFINHLYHSLHQSGIHAFLDDEFVRIGENITHALFRVIQESRIAIIVFSKNYANSTFCLRELEKILECFKEESRLIYPVFYYVDPSELRRPRGSYAKALARLEERFKDNRQKVDGWKEALCQAADFKGCHLKPRIANEQECIARITNEVAARINQEPLFVVDYPVGVVSRVKDVISCLDLWSVEESKMIGIWGAGGIGKSTIARAVYNSIADHFEGLCFLSDVRKRSKMPNGLTNLQETILFKLVMEKHLKLSDYREGIPIMKHRLSQKKVLLILDDIDESDQLEALAGSCDCFGSGSRIIITTRNKQLLVGHDVKSIYDVKGLDDEESLELLSWFAFKKDKVDSNYMEVSNRAIHYSCGFPLALEVIASNLRGKGIKHWSSALDQFRRIPHGRVFDALALSYDTLEEVEKQTFLDLVCFFNGEKLADVIHIMQLVHGIQLEFAIEMLIDKSLIKIEGGCVVMHDLIEDVGKEIVRRKSSYELGKRSRLWVYQDILQVLERDTNFSNSFHRLKSYSTAVVKEESAAFAAFSISETADFGTWERGKCIGAGGFGAVYVSHDRETGGSCAVKELRDIYDTESIASLRQEINILSKLEHPNIVKYYDHKIVDRRIYLYMEYIEPGSLKQYISKQGALDETILRKITKQILSGLVYLHSERVVHRDLKPDNILVDYGDIIKLVDFGLAKKIEESVGNHSVGATYNYAAPEIRKRKKTEYNSSGEANAADIWSLGCVIIEMFSREKPWPDSEKEHPPIPEELSKDGKDFLQRCFKIAPAERPSAAVLLDHAFIKSQST